LINDPAILFMDEPFAALDAITREELQHDLHMLCVQQGTSVLFVTHDIAEAVYLSDQVSVMHEGRLSKALPITLPRPRNTTLRHSNEFNALCGQLRQRLEGAQ